jgi:TRAP-type mannitol/chloroaromatic compound transport system permease large subunit
MIAFLVANMAPIMFGGLIVFLLFGYPVAFSLAACGLFFGFARHRTRPVARVPAAGAAAAHLRHHAERHLLAIPFFTFMGLILERSAWPRICSTPSASCSARSAAAWPMR